MADTAPDPLFTPVRIGAVEAPNRVFMAPLTRSRATDPDGVPTALMARYYAQRASAGLIISEATNISEIARGYAWTPGIYSAAQVAGWREVTGAVHDAGGRIVCQLWHTGRVSHQALHPDSAPVSASAEASEQSQAFIRVGDSGQRVAATPPRALEDAEIAATVTDYAEAAERALEAGFDGVEVHGANGYLLHQFLAPNVNRRTDRYGGDVIGRTRFAIEVMAAVAAAVGADRTGLRISPLFSFSGIDDPDPGPAHRYVAAAMSDLGIAYLHVADTNTMAPGVPSSMPDILDLLHGSFQGPLVVNGGLDGQSARSLVESGRVAAVAFGRAFLANPDLPRRLAEDLPLNEPDRRTFYGGADSGYTDYPAWSGPTPAGEPA